MTTSDTLPADLHESLRAWASAPRAVLATDFDGVLAPLVTDPMASRPQAGTVDALRALAALPGTTVAAVSGRDLDTLAELSGIAEGDGIVLVGSHGAQSTSEAVREALGGTLAPADRELLERLVTGAREVIREHPEARLEHKPAAVVVHTRGLPPAAEEAALGAARSLGESLDGVRVLPGKCVIELSVSHADKGSAVRVLAQQAGADATAYLGDDRTDEDVFVALTGRHDVTVKVGEGATDARHRIATCELVPDVLSLALATRRAANPA